MKWLHWASEDLPPIDYFYEPTDSVNITVSGKDVVFAVAGGRRQVWSTSKVPLTGKHYVEFYNPIGNTVNMSIGLIGLNGDPTVTDVSSEAFENWFEDPARIFTTWGYLTATDNGYYHTGGSIQDTSSGVYTTSTRFTVAVDQDLGIATFYLDGVLKHTYDFSAISGSTQFRFGVYSDGNKTYRKSTTPTYTLPGFTYHE